MSEHFTADITETFADYTGDSVTVSHFLRNSVEPFVYLDFRQDNLLIGTVSLLPNEFLKFADTVAAIATTIRENG